ncbi:Integrase [Streptococcus infantarius subsp. infantarius]|nr:Integrase [Streptococcus infantarius subsp. infantarius CJ18]MCO4646530.1 Integrase [Streptococcus infantarius subsp. infantarius]MCO4648561.1 Integrase [Streptococcus infantarius subsp. infantarius]MCO4650562.1 Integrase [Streptococcus infantarius subsp. infantarius]MCO4654395.1 Integrase [Streptococcus infantarius subsp. infantarius]
MTVKKAKNGTWTVDISDGFHPVTKKRIRIIRKGFKTKKEALELEQYIRVVELKEKRFDFLVTTDMLFDILEEEDRQNNRKISYITTQRNNYERHIKPYFINTNLNKLSYEHIFEFREHLKIKPKKQNDSSTLNHNTVNKIMILLKKIFDTGVRKSLIDKNPVENLRKLPISKPTINFWGIEEFNEFRKLIKSDEISYDLFFTIAFFTGMRMGEILALNWGDINLITNTIHITKTAYFVNGINHINNTKTRAGTRHITINNKLARRLADWKEEQENLLKEFTTDTGSLQVIQSTPIPMTKNMIDKKFKQILTRNNNLKKIRIHDLRHSHASLLINQGEDYLVVKERLGHASITTTIDTYSHLYPSKQKNLASKLDDFF